MEIIASSFVMYLLNKPIEEHNSYSRKSPTQAVIISFIIIIFNTIRIELELGKKMQERLSENN